MTLGSPGTPGATRLMLLGSGELPKEVAIEAQRFGIEVIAVDRYAGAPAMQVAHRSHVVNMLDGRDKARRVAAAVRIVLKPEWATPGRPVGSPEAPTNSAPGSQARQ